MKCNLCGHLCSVDRKKELGHCGLDNGIYISYFGLHFGEEPFFVGEPGSKDQGYGSGTIFFLGCNLRCSFCQNHQISRFESCQALTQNAKQISIAGLVEIFFKLKKMGAVNINLVSPTPYVFHLAKALKLAKQNGLELPVIYNSHGYDSPQALKLMNGLIDIYLPDAKYASDENAYKFSGIRNYPHVNQSAIKEMLYQVGHLKLKDTMAQKGLVVRHLVLPENPQNSLAVLNFLAGLGSQISISLMAQYHPRQELLSQIPIELHRTLTQEEYDKIIDHALALDLDNCLVQELKSHGHFLPDFGLEKSFQDDAI